MEYKTVLKVSSEEIYNIIIASIIGETNQATGKNITEKDLSSGYKYKRKITAGKKTIDVTTHIRKPIVNKKIQLNVDRQDNQYEMIYQFNAIDENRTEVVYTQTDKYKVKNPLQKLQFHLGMKKKFKQIEKYIAKQHKK